MASPEESVCLRCVFVGDVLSENVRSYRNDNFANVFRLGHIAKSVANSAQGEDPVREGMEVTCGEGLQQVAELISDEIGAIAQQTIDVNGGEGEVLLERS